MQACRSGKRRVQVVMFGDRLEIRARLVSDREDCQRPLAAGVDLQRVARDCNASAEQLDVVVVQASMWILKTLRAIERRDRRALVGCPQPGIAGDIRGEYRGQSLEQARIAHPQASRAGSFFFCRGEGGERHARSVERKERKVRLTPVHTM